MAGPPHHYMTNLNNAQQNPLRNPFVQNPMQNQMGTGIPMQMANAMGPQMTQGMMSPMSSTLGNQLAPGMGNSNPMLGQMNQQYNMNAGNQMTQPPNNLQMGNGGMGELQIFCLIQLFYTYSLRIFKYARCTTATAAYIAAESSSSYSPCSSSATTAIKRIQYCFSM